MASTKKIEYFKCLITKKKKKKLELQENSKHKHRSFSKEFKLRVVKYYHNTIKNNNKTARHFHVD